eukprot:CAMPEP_0197284854 /NCGR_PEP_ID=MMETSP1432-20130617/25654_1 /TAXON_ID=44447 /ORGANISM="Pseudo-nitzschia delicatissima, Strain UNC1205" /LENGTH=35 /DNA_ID= /DNA_START= /DNA_END= /DNA_ORIENTATION=
MAAGYLLWVGFLEASVNLEIEVDPKAPSSTSKMFS